jgi:hypothetical protein
MEQTQLHSYHESKIPSHGSVTFLNLKLSSALVSPENILQLAAQLPIKSYCSTLETHFLQ